jgi:hypothetical protein
MGYKICGARREQRIGEVCREKPPSKEVSYMKPCKATAKAKEPTGCRRLGKKAILPIWHKITRRDLLKYSPAFADRIAKVSQRDSISDIVKSLKALLKKG